MAVTYKVLGQLNPTANTLTTLYTTPGSTQTVVSTIAICNQGSSSTSYRLAVQPGNASVVSKHYINYDTVIPANSTITQTIGITLGATDVISVSTVSSTVSFSAFGSEIG